MLSLQDKIIIETLSVTSSAGTFCLVYYRAYIFRYNCMTCKLKPLFVLFNKDCFAKKI